MTNRFLHSFRALAVTAGLLAPCLATAQSASRQFDRSSRILSVGLLTGGNYDGLGVGGSFEVGAYSFTPSLSLGLGAFAGFVRDDIAPAALPTYTKTSVPIMAIGNVHLALASQPKLDLYGGLSLGVVSVSQDYGNRTPPAGVEKTRRDSDLGVGLQVGARYAFSPRVIGFGQLGASDVPLLYTGFSFNF